MSRQNSDAKEKKDGEQLSFYPSFLFEITLSGFFLLELLLILAILFPAAVGREIDFAAQYSPRPEWYFLFLYQLTKYFPGNWTFVGAVLLPGLAFSLILFAPFLDRSSETSLKSRVGAALAGCALFAAVIALTVLSLL